MIDTKQYKGTIIITDPCYFIPTQDYERTNYGKDLNKLGFTTYQVAGTGYGDWLNVVITDYGFSTFDADSGQVAVVYKDELVKYYDGFENLRNKRYVEIQDFEGEITIDTTDTDWTVITGVGNVNFRTADSEDESDQYIGDLWY